MTFRLPAKPILKTNAVSTPQRVVAKGTLTASRQIVRKERDGEDTVLDSETKVLELPERELGPNTGISGLALGLTIPGPKGSYMTARVDVACYLPHGSTPAHAAAAIAEAREVVQEPLSELAEECQAFFAS